MAAANPPAELRIQKTLAGANFVFSPRHDGAVETGGGCLISFIPESRRGAGLPLFTDFSLREFEKQANASLGVQNVGWIARVGNTAVAFREEPSWLLVLSFLESRLQKGAAGAGHTDVVFYGQAMPIPLGYDIYQLYVKCGLWN